MLKTWEEIDSFWRFLQTFCKYKNKEKAAMAEDANMWKQSIITSALLSLNSCSEDEENILKKTEEREWKERGKKSYDKKKEK